MHRRFYGILEVFQVPVKVLILPRHHGNIRLVFGQHLFVGIHKPCYLIQNSQLPNYEKGCGFPILDSKQRCDIKNGSQNMVAVI